jgi:hypothetical protein
MNTTFTIHKAGNSVIDADFATSEPARLNNITRGETAEFTFRNMITRLTVESGETFTVPAGTTEQVDFVEVFGTLDVDGTLEADSLLNQGTVDNDGTLKINERFAFELEDLKAYRRFAGKANLTPTLSATQKFSENIDETELETLVIGIEPNDDLQDEEIPGVWGVVNSITDERNQALNTDAATISVDVLALYSEYNSVSDVTNNLKL